MSVGLDNVVEQVAALVKLTREEGVAVELEHFPEPGWAWSFEGDRFRVTGPSAGWLPEVRRLQAALAYSYGCVWQHTQQRAEMVTWREGGVGFRVEFTAIADDG